ncbi:DUF4190 domain-containing protein [Microbacteriaceae bacterium VKM Ac-2855]|nr:DUF4190 domain-containing protein [Microbacteriaceae bacterium VKM Ac-2855]
MSDDATRYPPPSTPPSAPPSAPPSPSSAEEGWPAPESAFAPAPLRARLNPLAVLSLITGILLLAPAAIVLGHVGIAQLTRRGERGRGLAITGLVLGYLGTVLLVAAWVLVSAWIAGLRNDGFLPA